MTKTAVHARIDKLQRALAARGIKIKRSDAIEAVANLDGYRNSHEMMASANGERRVDAQAISIEEASALRGEIADLKDEISAIIRMGPDWQKFERSLKKASHHSQGPLSDGDLEMLRHAVADNMSKSCAAERNEARRRQALCAERMLPALLARLDKAEADSLASLSDALRSLTQLHQVQATRDGDICDEVYVASEDEARERGIRIAAKAFSISAALEDSFAGDDIESRLDFVEGEFDTFEFSRPVLQIDSIELQDACDRGEALTYINNAIIRLEKSAVLSE